MIISWRRLRHLVSPRSRWWTIVQYRAHPSIWCVKRRYKPLLEILLIEHLRILFVRPWPRLGHFIPWHIKDSPDLSLMLAHYLLVIPIMLPVVLIELTLGLVRSRTDLGRSRALRLVMAEDWALETVLGWIEKLETGLLKFQVESGKLLIAVVLAGAWNIFFGLQVIIYNFLLNRSFIICHCWWFIYLRVLLVFPDTAMGSTPHVPPASVHHMSPSESFLNLNLLQLRGCLPMLNDLLVWLINHPRDVRLWHLKQTLTVIGRGILVEHVTQSRVGVLESKFVMVFKPKGALLIGLAPAAHTCNPLRDLWVVGTWAYTFFIRVFFDGG